MAVEVTLVRWDVVTDVSPRGNGAILKRIVAPATDASATLARKLSDVVEGAPVEVGGAGRGARARRVSGAARARARR